MRKVFITLLTIAGIAIAAAAQESKTMYIMKKGEVVYQSAVSEIDSLTFVSFSSSSFDEGVVINGVKWATRNVNAPGTFADNPEDAGMFYQWNRRIGWSATDPMINSNGGNTWDSSTPAGDAWEKANDPSPSGWRVPTNDEIQKLLDTDKVSNEWTTQNGINGRKFTDIATGKTLFLPAAGYRYFLDGTLGYVGTGGYYWSSTAYDSNNACLLGFGSDYAVWYYLSRYNGFTVRSVAQESKMLYVIKNDEVAYRSAVSEIDSIIFYEPVTETVDEESVIINGVKWATHNVDKPGTFTANPEDAGMFYQWNHAIGWSATDPMVNSNGGEVWYDDRSDEFTSWKNVDDPSPVGWRVPTYAEIQTLLDANNVSRAWTTQNGVNGMKFTDKASGNSIFLPVAGYRNNVDGTLSDVGSVGRYWSTLLNGAWMGPSHFSNSIPNYLYFNFAYCYCSDSYTYTRGLGLSVRSVAALGLSCTNYAFGARGGTSPAINVTSNQSWTVSSNALWLTTSVTYSSFTMRATANTSTSSRSATVTVTTGDGITDTISVMQNDVFGVAINGIIWATCNVDQAGTFAAKPEDSGMFYQWNRKKGWPATSDVTGWDSSFPTGDNWEKSNDPSPTGWRVPTFDEIQLLLDVDKVSNEWTTLNSIKGRKFTDKATGNSLFLPAAGYRSNYVGGTFGAVDEIGDYWSSTATDQSSGHGNNAYYLGLAIDFLYWYYGTREDGFSVRSVADLLTVSSTSYTFGASSGTSPAINITSDQLWTVSSNASWLTTSATSGSDSGSFTMTATANISTSSRSATVTVTCDGITSTIINVTQKAVSGGVEINGVIWATCNVDKPGTFAAKPENAGMFYQWNRKVGWSVTNPMMNSDGGTTWDNSVPTGDTWESANDPSPAGWRVPTNDEIQKLLDTDKVSNEWTTQNGINGRKFTDIATGKTLFLPAAGVRGSSSGGALGYTGTYGFYWSSARFDSDDAFLLIFDSGGADWSSSPRINGFTVRSVAE